MNIHELFSNFSERKVFLFVVFSLLFLFAHLKSSKNMKAYGTLELVTCLGTPRIEKAENRFLLPEEDLYACSVIKTVWQIRSVRMSIYHPQCSRQLQSCNGGRTVRELYTLQSSIVLVCRDVVIEMRVAWYA